MKHIIDAATLQHANESVIVSPPMIDPEPHTTPSTQQYVTNSDAKDNRSYMYYVHTDLPEDKQPQTLTHDFNIIRGRWHTGSFQLLMGSTNPHSQFYNNRFWLSAEQYPTLTPIVCDILNGKIPVKITGSFSKFHKYISY